MADMFGVDLSVANRQISNFVDIGELDASTFAEFARVQIEGGRRVERAAVKHYGLDVAFYVGYRVNSAAGVLFRKWATDSTEQASCRPTSQPSSCTLLPRAACGN